MADATVALSNSPPKLEPVTKRQSAQRAAIYTRVNTADQHPETQLYDLREMATQRGYEIVDEYSDVICGAKSKRPGLDQLMVDARRGRFDIVLVAAFDRVARSVRHFLEVLDELNHLNIEFISLRENIDTSGGTRTKSNRRARPGWNAASKIGRTADWPCSAGYRPRASRP
jgi:DNA invertase Pin-like site-specific DNA recombinase